MKVALTVLGYGGLELAVMIGVLFYMYFCLEGYKHVCRCWRAYVRLGRRLFLAIGWVVVILRLILA
jgi:hypothetical protein